MKKIVSGLVRLDQIKGHRCAWKGCTAVFPIKGDLPPKDWRWLMLWWGPAGHSPLHLPTQFLDRDAVLCPEHVDLLHNALLEDIGQRLDNTEGSA